MSEFKEKLKNLLNQKDNKNDLMFNNHLLKIYKKIKRENSTKSFHSNINRAKYTNNCETNNLNNLNNYLFKKIKKCKSSNNLLNIMGLFSIYDIHSIHNSSKKPKKYDNCNKNSYIFNRKLKYKIEPKTTYIDSKGQNPYKMYMNNTKLHKNIINTNSFIQNSLDNYKENKRFNSPNNKYIIYKKNINNFFRTGNKMNYPTNNKIYRTSFLKNDIFY